jgi:hypothetical protein
MLAERFAACCARSATHILEYSKLRQIGPNAQEPIFANTGAFNV